MRVSNQHDFRTCEDPYCCQDDQIRCNLLIGKMNAKNETTETFRDGSGNLYTITITRKGIEIEPAPTVAAVAKQSILGLCINKLF